VTAVYYVPAAAKLLQNSGQRVPLERGRAFLARFAVFLSQFVHVLLLPLRVLQEQFEVAFERTLNGCHTGRFNLMSVSNVRVNPESNV
jgi:hypothetical protein